MVQSHVVALQWLATPMAIASVLVGKPLLFALFGGW
jgi:hypothetical protein